jgi:orotate phosphoribosyltransferase-like protein
MINIKDKKEIAISLKKKNFGRSVIANVLKVSSEEVTRLVAPITTVTEKEKGVRKTIIITDSNIERLKSLKKDLGVGFSDFINIMIERNYYRYKKEMQKEIKESVDLLNKKYKIID